MQENKSGCFFLNTVYIVIRKLVIWSQINFTDGTTLEVTFNIILAVINTATHMHAGFLCISVVVGFSGRPVAETDDGGSLALTTVRLNSPDKRSIVAVKTLPGCPVA